MKKSFWKKWFVSYICRWDFFAMVFLASTLIYLNIGHRCFIYFPFLLNLYTHSKCKTLLTLKMQINKAIPSFAILLKSWYMHTFFAYSINYTFTSQFLPVALPQKLVCLLCSCEAALLLEYIKLMLFIWCFW